ncbi:hypothetical protein B0H11DRAFT_1345733 [Mycena galericulata]|nr:hypothetical protein B0H11DRAFT_1345733 [Mycena galericulata]
MSVYVNGSLAPSSSYSGSPRTSISAGFAAALARAPVGDSVFIISVDTGHHGLRSMSLSCAILTDAPTSVVLGQDWAAYLRYGLSCGGVRLDETFDPWAFICDPNHPLTSPQRPTSPQHLLKNGGNLASPEVPSSTGELKVEIYVVVGLVFGLVAPPNRQIRNS